MYWELIAIFNLLKFRFRVDIFGIEKCKVTFGLKYIYDKIMKEIIENQISQHIPPPRYRFMYMYLLVHVNNWDRYMYLLGFFGTQ